MFQLLNVLATAIAILKSNILIAFALLLLLIDRTYFVLLVACCLSYEAGGQAGYSSARAEVFDVQSQADRLLRPIEWDTDPSEQDEPF